VLTEREKKGCKVAFEGLERKTIVDQLCQFAAKSVYPFSQYRANNFDKIMTAFNDLYL